MLTLFYSTKTADKRKWETTEETIREVNKIRRK